MTIRLNERKKGRTKRINMKCRKKKKEEEEEEEEKKMRKRWR